MCNICGNHVSSIMMRVTEHYEQIKSFHKIIVLPTEMFPIVRCFEICVVCSIKHKGKKIIGRKTPLGRADKTNKDKYYDSDILDLMTKQNYTHIQLIEIIKKLNL